MPKRKLFIVPLAALTLALTACGDDEVATDTTEEPNASTETTEETDAEANESADIAIPEDEPSQIEDIDDTEDHLGVIDDEESPTEPPAEDIEEEDPIPFE